MPSKSVNPVNRGLHLLNILKEMIYIQNKLVLKNIEQKNTEQKIKEMQKGVFREEINRMYITYYIMIQYNSIKYLK